MACSTVITLVVNVPLYSTQFCWGCTFLSSSTAALPPPAPPPPQLVRELLRRGMSCQRLLDDDARLLPLFLGGMVESPSPISPPSLPPPSLTLSFLVQTMRTRGHREAAHTGWGSLSTAAAGSEGQDRKIVGFHFLLIVLVCTSSANFFDKLRNIYNEKNNNCANCNLL